MGKTAMCIQMLQILNTGRVYKISELAEMLETNPRNIVEYKKELEECGYYIDTIPGRYGGYKLDQSEILPAFKFTLNEIDVIDEATNYLLTRNDFMLKDKFHGVMTKIYSSISKENFINELTVINRYPLAMPEEELNKRFEIIRTAIINKRVLKLKYVSQKNIEREHLYHPYDLFMYNNAWFVIGWCETWNDVIYFKLNRITEISQTSKIFRVYKFYNKRDYIDDFGFKKNGEWYHIEFEAYDTYASLVKERIYGKNQEIIPIDEKKTLVKVDMQNKENILVFILGFNKHIKVLEPQWLIDELKDFKEYLSNLY